MKNVIFLCFFLITHSGYSQRLYTASQTELIFSAGNVNATSIPSSSVVRFSGFLNYESQVHFNFNKKSGFYTGLGIKNIGMINDFDKGTITFKQRAYALSVPLALKLGNVGNQGFIALGAEANLMLNYKEKFLYSNAKTSKSEWFSNKVNTFNPAVFFQIKFLKSQIITFKYYMNDFLKNQSGGLALPNGDVVSDFGKSSKLFYISWGSNFELKKAKVKVNGKKAIIRTARLTE
jgi:hypothetical protein